MLVMLVPGTTEERRRGHQQPLLCGRLLPLGTPDATGRAAEEGSVKRDLIIRELRERQHGAEVRCTDTAEVDPFLSQWFDGMAFAYDQCVGLLLQPWAEDYDS
jgi:hypothetical protein